MLEREIENNLSKILLQKEYTELKVFKSTYKSEHLIMERAMIN